MTGFLHVEILKNQTNEILKNAAILGTKKFVSIDKILDKEK